MPLEILAPEGLDSPQTYSHVITAASGKLVFIAGQMSDDPEGNLVAPDDFAAQARQVFANLGRALWAANARPDQVTGSESTSPATAASTCPSSRTPGSPCSATTSPPTL